MPANDPIIKDRISAVSSGVVRESYTSMKTPDVEADIGTALRAGGAPNLYSKEYCGLLAQYAYVGLIYGVIPNVIYPLLQQYLNMEGNMITAANVLVVIPWSFKVVFGMLSDMFPIFGYRRRPYMIIGWSVCIVMLFVMGLAPIGDPYYPKDWDEKLRTADPTTYTQAQKDALNPGAPGKGSKYVMLMMLSSCGYLLADVCADGIMVELAQREPEDIRGTSQTTVYYVRTLLNIVANILLAFAFNGKEYGGDFDFSLSFPTFMLILAIVTIPVLPITWMYIREEKFNGIDRIGYLNDMWQFVQQRAAYQVIAYKFMSGIFFSFTWTASSPAKSNWAKVHPLNDRISTILGLAVFAVSLKITMKYGLHWNWRTIIIITTVATSCLDAICTFLTTWDVLRDQWFWLGAPIAENLPQGINFIVSTYVTVELADIGTEAAVYGLVTTVDNLASPIAGTITRYCDAPINVTNDSIKEDTHEVRMRVTKQLIVYYGSTLFSLVFLFMLPRQKAEVAELKRNGGSNKIIGGITVAYVILGILFSVSTNIMGIYDSTACLIIAGGSGC